MDDYLNELFSHMFTAEELHKEHFNDDMGSIIEHLFKPDTGVEVLLSYKEDCLCGKALVVYTYKDKYFHLEECFGSCSGCDDWDSNTLDEHTIIVNNLKKDIADNLVDNIFEVTRPLHDYQPDYVRQEWATILKSRGDDVYAKCIVIKWEQEQEYKKKQEVDRVYYEEENAKIADRIEKEKAEQQALRRKNDEDVLLDVRDTIEWLEHNTKDTDPFYHSKLSFKIKLLQFHLKTNGSLFDADLKRRGDELVHKYRRV